MCQLVSHIISLCEENIAHIQRGLTETLAEVYPFSITWQNAKL
jgi:hypothetical protein